MGLLVLLALLAFPLAEIALLIVVGRAIGVAATLGLLVLAGVIGVGLIRVQGFATLLRVRAALERGEAPTDALFRGACFVAAGLLLILPGFLSDIIALALLALVPPRNLLKAWLWKRATRRGARGSVIIEGEFRPVEDNAKLPGHDERASPWRRGEDDGSLNR
jgi:UPF0716 protein FxsA